MWRTALAIVALIVGLWFVIDWIYTSDRERVEQRLARLIEAAREGGEDAVEEILAAFADDYRGERPYDLKNIERYLKRYVGDERVRELETGGYKAVWAGDEIYVPLLRVTGETSHGTTTVLVEIWFSPTEDGDWEIAKISRPKFAR